MLTYKANTDGMAITEKIYDDSNGEEINSTFPEEAMHRSVDLAIVHADQEGTDFCVSPISFVDPF